MLASWNTDINNKFESIYILSHKNQLSNEDCNKICRTLKKMCLKESEIKTDTNNTAYALQGYFSRKQISITSRVGSGRR